MKPPSPNQFMHQRVIEAVDYHLSMKGYEKVESNPDFYVTYHATTKEEEEQRITPGNGALDIKHLM